MIKIIFNLYHSHVDRFVLLHCIAMGILVVMADYVFFVGHILATKIITKFVPYFKGQFAM